ncbi:hypothetical protein BOX30_04520 [Leptospirillum ferriphilum]|nr:hypothetical protein BOX30_04520 [Leptospirillum ferriphilum]
MGKPSGFPLFFSSPSSFFFLPSVNVNIFFSPKQIPLVPHVFSRKRQSQRSSRILDIFNSLRLEWEQDSFFPVNGDRDLEKQSLQMTSQ